MVFKHKVRAVISESKRLFNRSPDPGSLLVLHGSCSSDLHQAEVYDDLQRSLGVGARGSVGVWRCRASGRLVAVKKFYNEFLGVSREQRSKRAASEYGIGASFNHRNVIEMIELIEARNNWYQVMEYAPYDLFAAVATRKMSSEETACVFRQVICGIAYVHELGYAHRDMKLENIILNAHGIVKIIDFGCAVRSKSPTGRYKAHSYGI